ncbi:hypothetical protein N7453_010771, partial [Penicillium expansum]
AKYIFQVALNDRGLLHRVQIDLTSALIFGCGASGKLRELSGARLFCPAKSSGAHRLRHSPPHNPGSKLEA